MHRLFGYPALEAEPNQPPSIDEATNCSASVRAVVGSLDGALTERWRTGTGPGLEKLGEGSWKLRADDDPDGSSRALPKKPISLASSPETGKEVQERDETGRL